MAIPESAQGIRTDPEKIVIAVIQFCFRNREKSGLIRSWPHNGTYEVFPQSDLLLEVRAVLKKYERFLL